jgi:hypothetical protein
MENVLKYAATTSVGQEVVKDALTAQVKQAVKPQEGEQEAHDPEQPPQLQEEGDKTFRTRKLYLRLAVIAARDLYPQRVHSTDPYVVIEFGESSHTTPVQKTTNPVFDDRWQIEFPADERGNEVPIRFKVMDSDVGIDLLLGSATFKVPGKACSPRREILSLRQIPRDLLGSAPPDSKLEVIWHVVPTLQNQPDLVFLADLGEDAFDAQNWVISFNLENLRLFRARNKVRRPSD